VACIALTWARALYWSVDASRAVTRAHGVARIWRFDWTSVGEKNWLSLERGIGASVEVETSYGDFTNATLTGILSLKCTDSRPIRTRTMVEKLSLAFKDGETMEDVLDPVPDENGSESSSSGNEEKQGRAPFSESDQQQLREVLN